MSKNPKKAFCFRYYVILAWVLFLFFPGGVAHTSDKSNPPGKEEKPLLRDAESHPEIVLENPAINSHTAPVDTTVTYNAYNALTPPYSSNVNTDSLRLYGNYSGRVPGYFTYNRIIFHPQRLFFPGEKIDTIVTDNVIVGGAPAGPYVWQFRVGVPGGTGIFGSNTVIERSRQVGNYMYVFDVCFGDLNNDGHMDIILARYDGCNIIWYGRGSRKFSDGREIACYEYNLSIALGDLDGDGNLDLFVSRGSSAYVVLSSSASSAPTYSIASQSSAAAIGDLDGDGDLDVFTAGQNHILINDGNGVLTVWQSLGGPGSTRVALGDLDSDGDLDAFTATGSRELPFAPEPRETKNQKQGADWANRVWLNNGSGIFSDSGQLLGNLNSNDIDLGDLDGDGDLDACVGNCGGVDKVWLNDGCGVFSDSGQALNTESSQTRSVSLGDLDGDGDLDILFGIWGGASSSVWMNRGNGVFFLLQKLPLGGTVASEIGDLDGDGDLDVYIVCHASVGYNLIYYNQDKIICDFNNDYNVDIFLRNQNDGTNQIWYMDRTTMSGQDPVLIIPDTDWHIEGVADFNRDKYKDLVLRNYRTCLNQIWLMKGRKKIGQYFFNKIPDKDWHIEGLADFDRDGRPDLILSNYRHGMNQIWYMVGVDKTGQAFLPSLPDTSWRIEGAADFNGDNHPDLVLRNYITGENEVWFMENITRTGKQSLPPIPDLDWKIEGIGDFNGDRKPDLLLREYQYGRNQVWFMNGTVKIGQKSLLRIPDTNWHIEN